MKLIELCKKERIQDYFKGDFIAQDDNGSVWGYDLYPHFLGCGWWSKGKIVRNFGIFTRCEDWNTAVVTRAMFEEPTFKVGDKVLFNHGTGKPWEIVAIKDDLFILFASSVATTARVKNIYPYIDKRVVALDKIQSLLHHGASADKILDAFECGEIDYDKRKD